MIKKFLLIEVCDQKCLETTALKKHLSPGTIAWGKNTFTVDNSKPVFAENTSRLGAAGSDVVGAPGTLSVSSPRSHSKAGTVLRAKPITPPGRAPAPPFGHCPQKTLDICTALNMFWVRKKRLWGRSENMETPSSAAERADVGSPFLSHLSRGRCHLP